MDYLDRLEENEERFRAMRRHEPRQIAEPKPTHNITIIGVIRCADGWYRCGFDENMKTLVPVECIERRSIYFYEDCPMCANSDPKTNVCYDAVTINGGTPCIYWRPRNNNKPEGETE